MLSLKLPSILEIKSTIAFIINWLQSNWTNIFLSSLLIYLLVAKNITLELSLNNSSSPTKKTQPNNKPTKNLHATTASLSSTTSPLTKAQKEQINYVRRFAKVAQGEMQKYGIPASITLAQGLLESKAGKVHWRPKIIIILVSNVSLNNVKKDIVVIFRMILTKIFSKIIKLHGKVIERIVNFYKEIAISIFCKKQIIKLGPMD